MATDVLGADGGREPRWAPPTRSRSVARPSPGRAHAERHGGPAGQDAWGAARTTSHAFSSWAAARASFDLDAVTRYVLSRRAPGGGYCFYRTPAWGVEEPNGPDTLAALESLRLLNVEPPLPGETATYLRELQDNRGGFPTLTIGWAALSSLALLDAGPRHSPAPWLAREQPDRAQPPVGRERSSALRDALHLLEAMDVSGIVPGAPVRTTLARLLAGALDSRGDELWPGVDLEGAAVALRVISLAGLSRDGDARFRAFLEACEDQELGLRVRPDAAATSTGALWGGLVAAGILQCRLRGLASIERNLAMLQRADGGLGARHGAISTLHDTWRGLDAARRLDELQEETP
jgi:hypothetical protein